MTATDEQDAGSADDAMLLAFLQERDVACPLCGYNLRNLPRPECPECREPLALAVTVREIRFGWFLVTVVPGYFSGIAAFLLAIPITVSLIVGGGQPPWVIWVTDGFGWLSGLTALGLTRYRYAFLRRSTAVQRQWAVVSWAIHVVAFGLLLMAALFA